MLTFKAILLLTTAAATVVNVQGGSGPDGLWKEGAKGTDTCPTGYSTINSIEDCRAAVSALHSSVKEVNPETGEEDYPKGCYKFDFMSLEFFFNDANIGSSESSSNAICGKVTTTNPSPGPTTNPSPGPTTNPSPGPTTNPSPGPTTNPSPGPSNNPTSSAPSPTDECDSKLFQQYNQTGFKVASKNDAFTFITKIKTAFKAIKKSYRAAKTNLRKLGREAKE